MRARRRGGGRGTRRAQPGGLRRLTPALECPRLGGGTALRLPARGPNTAPLSVRVQRHQETEAIG